MSAAPEKSAVELMEEAVYLLRRAPASAWTLYFAGAGPFNLGLLWGWASVTRGVVAESSIVAGALGLALLFIWMKTCQAAFAGRLWSILSGVERPAPTLREWARAALAQARLQPWGWFVLPCAMLLTFPAGWAYAYYQNATALGAPRRDFPRDLHRLAVEQTRLWPKQNHLALAMLSGFSLVVVVNILIALLLLPQILITFFGMKEIFKPSGWLMLNTTFLALVASLGYLAVDPLIKAFYTLRCFYGQSLVTGEDLQARLGAARASRKAQVLAAVAAFAFLFAPGLRGAEMGGQAAADLDRSITETLKSSEYNWKFPREVVDDSGGGGWMHRFFSGVGDWLRDMGRAVVGWLDRLFAWLDRRNFREPNDTSGLWSWVSPNALLGLFAVIIAIVLAIVIFKSLRRRSRPAPAVSAVPVAPAPNVADESVGADQLPGDEWMRLARELSGTGELRLAIRALFLAALASMAQRQWIALARFKSNRDYEREFRRRGAAFPAALEAFGALVLIYNRVWYGLHEPSPEQLARCEESVRAIQA